MNKESRFYHTFRAFENRNYALYFGGQSLSLIGTWMQRTGVSWVVYTITHSSFMLGFTMFAQLFPSFIFSLYGGILSDRYNRYKILFFTQTASMVQAVLLAVLTFTNQFNVWGIISLSVILGIINAFDVPARQPLVHELVRNKEDLPNALALNSSMVNIARLIGPALSGIVLQTMGAGACFLLNAFSFLAVITSLFFMKLPPAQKPKEKKKIRSEFTEGFRYLKQASSIRITLLMLSLTSLFVFPYDTVIPVFAKVVFNGDAATYGYISSFMGLGAISGTLFLASINKGSDLKKILLLNGIFLGLGLILFSHITYFPVAMLFAIVTGFGTMSQTTIFLTILQVHSHVHMRGRVMSYMAMAYFGMLPLGSLLVGSISEQIGAPNTLLIQGILAVLITLFFTRFLRKEKLTQKEMDSLQETEENLMKKV